MRPQGPWWCLESLRRAWSDIWKVKASLFSVGWSWLAKFWGVDIQHQASFQLSNWNWCSVIPPPPRIVPDQDDHLACQKFCAETAHCVGYTFVKVAFDVVACVVVVLVVVAVVGGVVVVIIVVVDIPTPLSRVWGGATSRTPMVPRVLQTTGVQWYLGRRNLLNNCD